MRIYCKQCEVELFFDNCNRSSVDYKGHRLGRLCRECADKEEKAMKEKYFILEHKGNDIYEINGRFIPYWGCQYYFTSLRDCLVRIDNSHLSFIPNNFIRLMKEGDLC